MCFLNNLEFTFIENRIVSLDCQETAEVLLPPDVVLSLILSNTVVVRSRRGLCL